MSGKNGFFFDALINMFLAAYDSWRRFIVNPRSAFNGAFDTSNIFLIPSIATEFDRLSFFACT